MTIEERAEQFALEALKEQIEKIKTNKMHYRKK